MTEASHLPRYVQNLNRILDRFSQEPDKTWRHTQKDLSLELNLAQPTLSALLKMLKEQGRITEGPSIPGVRGRNRELILIDDTRFSHALRLHHDPKGDRVRGLALDEEVHGVVDLGELSTEKLGLAVSRFIQTSLEKEGQFSRTRLESAEKIREYRARLEDEKRQSAHLLSQKVALERKVESLEETITSLRAKINSLIRQPQNNNGSHKKETLSSEDKDLLDNLLRGGGEKYESYNPSS